MTRLPHSDLLMVGQSRRGVTSPTRGTSNDHAVNASGLRATFIPDAGDMLTGARCELPSGEVVEVKGRHTPLYDLARELEAQGYGDWKLQAYTPTGTPSLHGLVKVMAELTVKEGRHGPELRKFRPTKAGHSPGQRDLAYQPLAAPEDEEMRASDSPVREKAA